MTWLADRVFWQGQTPPVVSIGRFKVRLNSQLQPVALKSGGIALIAIDKREHGCTNFCALSGRPLKERERGMAGAIAAQMFTKSALEIDCLTDVAGFALAIPAMGCQGVNPIPFSTNNIASCLHSLRLCFTSKCKANSKPFSVVSANTKIVKAVSSYLKSTADYSIK